jgi:hypothetical protein
MGRGVFMSAALPSRLAFPPVGAMLPRQPQGQATEEPR